MGFLDRFKKDKKQRAEDWYSHSTYKPELEVLAAKNFNNPDHRALRAEEDPIIEALVVRVANLITARSPIFLDKEGNELEDIKETWEDLLYNDLLNDVIQATRTHGYVVVEALAEPLDDRTWLIHDSTDIIHTTYRKLELEKYTVLPLIKEGDKVAVLEVVNQYDLFPKDVIHFSIGKWKKNRLGVSPLKAIWHAAVRFTEILESMAMYDSRIGRGCLVVSVDPMAYKGEIGNLKNAIKNMNNRRFLILKQGVQGEKPDFDWEGATGGPDFGADLQTLLKVICGATGFPARWFEGDPKGAQSAAKEDRTAVWTTLKEIFEQYVPFIRKVLLMEENGEAKNKLVADIQFDDEGNLMEEDAEMLGETGQDEPIDEKSDDYKKSEKNYVKNYD